jgi:hypothetical protein
MKKYVLIAGLGLITAGGATAAVLYLNSPGKKKTTKTESNCCAEKSHCSKAAKTASY